MSFGNTLETMVLDHIFGKAAMSTVVTGSIPVWWAGLCTSDPTETGVVNEPTFASDGGTYDRINVPYIDWSRTGNTITNVSALTFATAASNWGQLEWAILMNHSVSQVVSDFLAYGSLDPVRTVNNGDSIRFPVGDFDVTLS
ncbi:MAG: phage tail fiber protein [Planctomycetota bacterium]|jgi:hypothetical protein